MCRRSIFLLWDILLQILKVVTLDTFERHVIMCCGHVKRRYFSIYSELHSLNKKATKIKKQSIWNILNDYMMYNGFTFEMTLQYNFTSWTYFDTIDSADQCNGSGDQFNYFYVLFGWIFLRRKYYLKVQPNVAGSNMTATENRIKQGVIAQINGQKARKYELMEHFLLLCALSAHIYAHLYIIV